MSDPASLIASIFAGVPSSYADLMKEYIDTWSIWVTAHYNFRKMEATLRKKTSKKNNNNRKKSDEQLELEASMAEMVSMAIAAHEKLEQLYAQLWSLDVNRQGKEPEPFPYSYDVYPPSNLLLFYKNHVYGKAERLYQDLPGMSEVSKSLKNKKMAPGALYYPPMRDLSNQEEDEEVGEASSLLGSNVNRNNNNNNADDFGESVEEEVKNPFMDRIHVERRILLPFRGASKDAKFPRVSRKYIYAWIFWIMSNYAVKFSSRVLDRLQRERSAEIKRRNKNYRKELENHMKSPKSLMRIKLGLEVKPIPLPDLDPPLTEAHKEALTDLGLATKVRDETYSKVTKLYARLWRMDPNHSVIPWERFPYEKESYPHYDLLHVEEMRFRARKRLKLKMRTKWNKYTGRYRGDYTADPRYPPELGHIPPSSLNYPPLPPRWVMENGLDDKVVTLTSNPFGNNRSSKKDKKKSLKPTVELQPLKEEEDQQVDFGQLNEILSAADKKVKDKEQKEKPPVESPQVAFHSNLDAYLNSLNSNVVANPVNVDLMAQEVNSEFWQAVGDKEEEEQQDSKKLIPTKMEGAAQPKTLQQHHEEDDDFGQGIKVTQNLNATLLFPSDERVEGLVGPHDYPDPHDGGDGVGLANWFQKGMDWLGNQGGGWPPGDGDANGATPLVNMELPVMAGEAKQQANNSLLNEDFSGRFGGMDLRMPSFHGAEAMDFVGS